MWWLIISINFHAVVVRDVNPHQMEKYYLILGWVFPALVTALAYNHLDHKPHPFNWECWMAHEKSASQWIFFYGEMGIACLLGVSLWPQIAHKIYMLHNFGRELLQYMRHILFIVFFLGIFGMLLLASSLSLSFFRPSCICLLLPPIYIYLNLSLPPISLLLSPIVFILLSFSLFSSFYYCPPSPL